MRKVSALSLCLFLALGLAPAFAAQGPDDNINARIRKEAVASSQIMRTMHFLTDIYGPRLTGSPNLKAAGEWAAKQMSEWGFQNAHLEPWEFGHPGWVNERLTAHLISPVKDVLSCEVLAWTPGTNGPVTAAVHQLLVPDRPTQEDLTKFLESQNGKIKGKIVLVGKHQAVAVNLTPSARRLEDKTVKERYDPNNPNAGRFGRRPREGDQQNEQGPPRLTPQQLNEQLDKFLIQNSAVLRVNDAGREHRQVRAFNNRSFDITKTLPTVVMSNEDYGRITRILADGTQVTLEFNVVNRIYPEGKTAYNTIAEIPGTDKKDEIVMLGGHLDSWHAATGATDNAIGCAIMMEAARILQALGIKPRRTIRVALWSGEEQGLLGSQAYVKQHFGSFENPKPDYSKLVAYLNIDSGTGRARGAGVFGPPEAAAVIRAAMSPFEDLGVAGAIATNRRNLGGSDHTAFNQAGLPGIGINQDPIEYNSATWHTNLDTYERIVIPDAQNSAIVIAAVVYQLAMREEMLPRFTKETMPALPRRTETPETQPATPPPNQP